VLCIDILELDLSIASGYMNFSREVFDYLEKSK